MVKKTIFLFSVFVLIACQALETRDTSPQTESAPAHTETPSSSEEHPSSLEQVLSDQTSFYYQVFQSLETAQAAPENIRIEGQNFSFYALEKNSTASDGNYYSVIYKEDKETS